MTIRVVRLMEYTYPDLETAHADMARWAVQGTFSPGGNKLITSTVIINPTPFESVIVREAQEVPE